MADEGRDRYLDLLRGASIVAVVVGHWLVADITYVDGQLQVHSSLGEVPGMWPLTWVFQVIPVFFFVAGAVNGPSWLRAQACGDSYGRFVDRKVRRVLVPTSLALLVIVACAGLVAALGGLGVTGAGAMLLQPLWFLAVYLVLVALTPWTWALHRRFGWRFVAGLVPLAVVVDVARVRFGLESVGNANVLVVWLLVYVLGYWAADLGSRRSAAWALLVVGAVGLAGLVGLGPYPARMVGVPGDTLVNMHPPTLAVLSLACAQIGLLALLRPAIEPWLARPAVWVAVVWVNLSIMTLYLWHEFVLVGMSRILLPAGVPQPAPGSVAWWLMRLTWVLVAGVALVGLVLLVGRFERLPPPDADRTPAISTPSAIAVVVALFAGLLALAGTHVTEPVGVQQPLGLPLSPIVALLLVLVAWLVLSARGRGRDGGSWALVAGAALLLVLGAGYATGALMLPTSTAVAVTCSVLAVVLLGGAAATAWAERHPPAPPRATRAGTVDRAVGLG